MDIKKTGKLILYTVILFVIILISGEGYLSYVDEELGNSDYYFYKTLDDPARDKDFLRDSKELCKRRNLELITVKKDLTGKNSVEYVVYCTKNARDHLGRTLVMPEGDLTLKSLISGTRRVIFKDLLDFESSSTDGKIETFFMMNGKADDVEEYRKAVIDEYGISNPTENGMQHDALFIILLAWVSGIVLSLLIEFVFIINEKREIAIRLVNGASKKTLWKVYGVKWIINFILPFIVLSVMSSIFIGNNRLLKYEIILAVCLSLVIGCMYKVMIARVGAIDARRKNQFSASGMFILCITLCLMIICGLIVLPITIFNIKDAVQTYSQKDIWHKYQEYASAYFMFRGENGDPNEDKDIQFRKEFYNSYLDKYDITILIDVSNNGGEYSAGDKSIIYANKNAKHEILKIIKNTKIEKDKYYVISNGSKRSVLDESEDAIDVAFGTKMAEKIKKEGRFVKIKNNYKLTTLDIYLFNLGDNKHENPLIVFDTHSTVDSREICSISLSGILKCTDEQFRSFINRIGCMDDIHYLNNVGDIYKDKLTEKRLMLITNLMLAVLWLVLFIIIISKVIREYFAINSIEIVMRKLYGASLLKRYKAILIPSTVTFLTGCIVAFSLCKVLLDISSLLIMLGIIAVTIVLGGQMRYCINRMEKKNIANIIKGEAFF